MKWRVMVELSGADGAVVLHEVSVGASPVGRLFGGNARVDGGGREKGPGRVAETSGPGADGGALPEPTPLPALWARSARSRTSAPGS